MHVRGWNNPIMRVMKRAGVDVKAFRRQVKVKPVNHVWTTGDDDDEGPSLLSKKELESLLRNYYDGRNGILPFLRAYESIGYDRSVRALVDDYARRRKLRHRERRIVEWMTDSEIVSDYSGNLEELSSQNWEIDGDFDGVDLQCADDLVGGYGRLADDHAAPFRDRVLLDYRVVSIDWSAPTVVVSCRRGGVTDDAERRSSLSFRAKKVVSTLPLGVLRSGTVLFVPALPAAKSKAASRIGVGLLNKCILAWDDENDILPWPDAIGWIEIIRCGKKEQQGRFTEFYRAPRSAAGVRTVHAFLAGRIAETIECESDEAIREEALSTLRELYGTVPDPTRAIISRWGSDEYARGSYTFNRVGQSLFDRKTLGAPLKRRLYFAGEATNHNNFGTTHGAMATGISAARNATMPFPFSLLNF